MIGGIHLPLDFNGTALITGKRAYNLLMIEFNCGRGVEDMHFLLTNVV